jgi:hypothetical protein
MRVVDGTELAMVDRYPAPCPGSVGLVGSCDYFRDGARGMLLGLRYNSRDARIGWWHNTNRWSLIGDPTCQRYNEGNLGGRQTAGREDSRGVGDVAWQRKEKIDEIDRRCTKKDPGPPLSESLTHSGQIWNGTRGTKPA